MKQRKRISLAVVGLTVSMAMLIPVNAASADDAGTVIRNSGVQVTMSSTEHSQESGWFWNLTDKNASKPDWTVSNAVSAKDAIDLTNVTDTADENTADISVDDTKTYQTITGIGTSVDGSTVGNWWKMSESKRAEFIRTLLDPVNGMGLTSFRLTIGAADFTDKDFYTYYDAPNATLNGVEPNWDGDGITGFSIQKDHDEHIIDFVHALQSEAKNLGVDISFFASPWSPPGWMKTPTSSSSSYADNSLLLKGGDFNSEHINDYAKYLVRYIEEYQKEGIPVSALTLQNEPLLEIDYPSCHMTGTQEAQLATSIKSQLAASTVLNDAEKQVQVWAFDHNFDGADSYVSEMKQSPEDWANVDGIAFHPYGGNPSTMGALSQANPDKSIHLTERSWWGTTGANWMIDWFRNGSQSYNSWVSMLDSEGKTHHWVGTPDPTTFVQNAKNPDDVVNTPEVNLISQFSRYIRPGDVRVDSTAGSPDTLTNVAFKNPSTGEISMVVVNRTDKEQKFKVVNNGAQFVSSVPAKNVATYRWQPIDQTKAKDVTADLTLADATLDGAGTKNDTAITGLDKTSTVEYLVNVRRAGTYKVMYALSAASGSTRNTPVTLSSGGNELGTAHYSSDNAATSTAQTTVTLGKGIQILRVAFPEGGVNYAGIAFTKTQDTVSIPGRLDATNYTDRDGVRIADGKAAAIADGDHLDYAVNVQKTDTYDVMVSGTGANVSGNDAEAVPDVGDAGADSKTETGGDSTRQEPGDGTPDEDSSKNGTNQKDGNAANPAEPNTDDESEKPSRDNGSTVQESAYVATPTDMATKHVRTVADTNTAGVSLYSVDGNGTETKLGDYVYGTKATVQLAKGTATLRIKLGRAAQSFSAMVIGNAITDEQEQLTEGSLTGKSITLALADGQFVQTFDPAKWTFDDAPHGIAYTVDRVNDTTARVTFTTESDVDFDSDMTATLNVDASQYSGTAGTAISAPVTFTAVNDPESLSAGEIGYQAKSVDVTITGGTFNDHVADDGVVSLTGDIAAYATLTKAERKDVHTITLTLDWTGKTLYGSTSGSLTVAANGYDDSDGQGALSVDLTFNGTNDMPTGITVGDQEVTLGGENARPYRGVESLSGNQKKGDYQDYYLNVTEEGDYTITFGVWDNGAVPNAIKLSGGTGFATDNLASISLPNMYNGTGEYKTGLYLKAGGQTLRFELNAEGASLWNIRIAKANAVKTSADSPATLAPSNVINGSTDKAWAIQGSNPSNIGWGEADSYQDYLVNVAKTGTYVVTLDAATGSDGAVAHIQTVDGSTATDLAQLNVPNTGWDSYQPQTTTVQLTQGEHRIRVLTKGTSLNYRSLKLTLSKAITPIAVGSDTVSLNEDKASDSNGSLSNNQKNGNYAEYTLNVAEEGDYTLTYGFWVNAKAVPNAIRISGSGLEPVSVSLPNTWDVANTGERRTRIHLVAGEQTLRVALTADSASVWNLRLTKAHAADVGTATGTSGQVRLTTDAIIGGSDDKAWGLQGTGSTRNIGWGEENSYQEFSINAKQGGTYQFSLNAATNDQNASAVIEEVAADGTINELAALNVPQYGWDVYATTGLKKIPLTEGEHLLRIVTKGGAVNYRYVNLTLQSAEQPTPPTVDKTQLNKLIEQAQNRKPADGKQFTAEPKAALDEALSNALRVSADGTATQQTVDDAARVLQSALDGLKEEDKPTQPTVDKSALEALVEKAESLKPDDGKRFTAASKTNLDKAIAAAKSILDSDNATKEQVEAAKSALQQAIDGLEQETIPSSGSGASSDRKTNTTLSRTGAAIGVALAVALALVCGGVTLLLVKRARSRRR